VQAPDGSHLERGEVLVDRMKQAQLSYKMGISTDRLQLVAAPDSLNPGRIYLPSFLNDASIQLHFMNLVEFINNLGSKYSSLVTKLDWGAYVIGDARTSLITQQSTERNVLCAATGFLIIRGVVN